MESGLGFFPRFGLQNFFFGGGGRNPPASSSSKAGDPKAAMKTYTVSANEQARAILAGGVPSFSESVGCTDSLGCVIVRQRGKGPVVFLP